uniref:hypothetical protein n=1 Tax=Parerythrobacter lutipelagi TaxID=1964208 RepID=UPI0010F5E120|nr:hypothetical protein [Parerythrobacter lutipelagi]
MALIFPLGLLLITFLSFLMASGLRRLFAQANRLAITSLSAVAVGFLPTWAAIAEGSDIAMSITPSVTLALAICSWPAWIGSRLSASSQAIPSE